MSRFTLVTILVIVGLVAAVIGVQWYARSLNAELQEEKMKNQTLTRENASLYAGLLASQEDNAAREKKQAATDKVLEEVLSKLEEAHGKDREAGYDWSVCDIGPATFNELCAADGASGRGVGPSVELPPNQRKADVDREQK